MVVYAVHVFFIVFLNMYAYAHNMYWAQPPFSKLLAAMAHSSRARRAEATPLRPKDARCVVSDGTSGIPQHPYSHYLTICLWYPYKNEYWIVLAI